MLAQNYPNTQEGNQKTESSRFEELVKQYESPVKALVHNALESFIREAFNDFMGPRTGKEVIRDSDGKMIIDYRNGSRTVKQLMADTLVLEEFEIPRNRAGGFRPEILQRLKRRAGKFASLALELFVNGVSTRKVRRSFERASIKISGLSKSTVSRISKDLIKEYLLWSNRKITEKFRYLQADAVYIKNRANSPVRTGTLMITGITAGGNKEILHFTLGVESERNYDEVLQNLINRGLDAKAVKLITIDGAKGPLNSFAMHFGEDKIQRCTVHKTKNILDKAPRALRDEIKAKLKRLWNQSSGLEAKKYFKVLYDEYKNAAPNAMECLKGDIDQLLRFYDFPESHRKSIRSTNLIERVIREVRRRTKVMDSLDNEYGIYGIVMGVVREQNERWSNKSHWRKIR